MLAQAPGCARVWDVGGRSVMNTISASFFGREFGSYTIVEGVANMDVAQAQSGVFFDLHRDRGGTRRDRWTLGRNPEPWALSQCHHQVRGAMSSTAVGVTIGMNQRLEANNIDEALARKASRNPPSLKLPDDLDGNVVGDFVRDRLWFWIGARNQRLDRDVLGCVKPR